MRSGTTLEPDDVKILGCRGGKNMTCEREGDTHSLRGREPSWC